MLRGYLSWLGINTAHSWYTAALPGRIYFASLSDKNRNNCECKWSSSESKCISTFCAKVNQSRASRLDCANIRLHFDSILLAVVRPEHWLRPHSHERPGLPCRDVPSNQTPSSHHAPVTVAAYSRAHHPQGPGQGGLPSHINIFFMQHGWTETCTS